MEAKLAEKNAKKARKEEKKKIKKKELEERNMEILSSGFDRIPQVTKELTEEQIADVEKLLEKIEEDDDVQNVYTTMA